MWTIICVFHECTVTGMFSYEKDARDFYATMACKVYGDKTDDITVLLAGKVITHDWSI